MRLHASCVDMGGYGILLTGRSGSGKSDLALRLIREGAVLVADDQTDLHIVKDSIVATVPEALAGVMEIRGVGVLKVDHVSQTTLALVIELTERERLERLPESQRFDVEGIQVPKLSLHAFDFSTPLKIMAFLHAMEAGTFVAGAAPVSSS